MRPGAKSTGGAGSSRAARWLLLAFLAVSLVSRVADANPHPDLWYVPCVVACYVLPAWYAIGRWPAAWERVPVLLLVVQAAVTYVPMFAFGPHWVGGVDGLLAGLALVLLRAPVSWWVAAALAAGELFAWLGVGLPYQPAIHSSIWLLVAYATVALGYFGLSDAARLLERLESTAEVLADAAVDRERLATAEGLQATIVRRLDDIQRHASAALAPGAAAQTTTELRRVGEAAREAAASARRIVSAIPEPAMPRASDPDASPSQAFRIVVAVALLYAVQFVMNSVFPPPGSVGPTVVTNVVALAGVTALVLLQLRHSRQRAGGRPAGWAWTLAAQAALCVALFLVFGAVGVGPLAFLCGSVLLLMARPYRWLIVAVVLATIPALAFLSPSDSVISGIQGQWALYATATITAASLVIYGLGRFVRAAAELADARSRLAETAVTRERVRIARDTHDTLGLALSAIALKSDLAQALLAREPARARREIVQTIHLSRTVAADAESIVHGTLRLHLDTELTAARDALDAAGASTSIERARVPMSAAAETELAAILREAVANVLRHSDAQNCSIRIRGTEGEVVVEVVNDGAHEPVSTGRGLDNMRERAAALGGTVTVTADRGSFALEARIPREPARRPVGVP